MVTELTDVRKSNRIGSRDSSHSLGFSFTTLQREDFKSSLVRLSRTVQLTGVRIWEMFHLSDKILVTCRQNENHLKLGAHAQGLL